MRLRGPEAGYYWFLLFLLALVLFPLGVGRVYSIFYLNIGTQALILGLFALSVDILMGYTGLVPLGPAAFFGLGAYAGAITLLRLGNSIWLVLLISLALSAVVALIIGYFIIRAKGVYFAFLTLAFAGMFYELAFRWQSFTGGSDGLTGVPDPAIGIPPYTISLGNPYAFFYFTLAVVTLVYYLCVRLVNSPFGQVLRAIKDNEERVEFLGYNVRFFKLRAFVVSGIVGGLSGALFANLRFIDPIVFHWFTSAESLVMVLLGGMGTLYGPIIGAVAYLLSRDVISSYTGYWRLILGLIFVGFVIFFPQGIVGLFRFLRARLIPLLVRSPKERKREKANVRLQITVKEVEGDCPFYRQGDSFSIIGSHRSRLELERSPGCAHAQASLMSYCSDLLKGAKRGEYVQCSGECGGAESKGRVTFVIGGEGG
ncbi:MAG: branched-chain amino acid ABC transporter permease [Candidatus Bipolaricaulia bacterium]